MRRVIYNCDACGADLEIPGPDGDQGLSIANIKMMREGGEDWPTVEGGKHFCGMACLSAWAGGIAAKTGAAA